MNFENYCLLYTNEAIFSLLPLPKQSIKKGHKETLKKSIVQLSKGNSQNK